MITFYTLTILTIMNGILFGFEVIEYEVDFKYDSKLFK